MAGTFILGETKIRPGTYFNIKRKDRNDSANVMNGVTAVIFKSDFGPLNKVVELNAEDGYESVFGNALTTDALREVFAGGAKTIIACRVGNGGTVGSVVLKEAEETQNALTVSCKYPGAKSFSVTIRPKLSDASLKECIIYSGTTEFEKLEFAAGTGEVAALKKAFDSSRSFSAEVSHGKENSTLASVSHSVFSAGSNPSVSNNDYSNAFAQVEAFEFNTICVDTEDTAIHLLLQSFMNRIFDAASLAQGVVAELQSVDLTTRMAHAAAFNDEKMHYVLNAKVNEQGVIIDGYKTAARIAGMIGSGSSASSLTHTVINGFTEILEKLTNTQITSAQKKGCIVLTYNKNKQVWVDNAINTLITPSKDQDDGWKKIRRVKTRFELIRRINDTTDNLVGKVDNDKNGINTVISQIQGVGDSMVEENKLVSCKVKESDTYTADGDSAWFDIDVIDKDSMEHIYLTFLFRFSTKE